MHWTESVVSTIAGCAISLSLGAFAHIAAGQTPRTAPSPQIATSQSTGREWWNHAVIYEIYPRSFQDSDGDGIGDIKGITSRLDYLRDLGVDAIWITPMYPSPGIDYGYDISDYTAIDPVYGTLPDFDNMVAEAKKRNIRVIMDYVINHTSDQNRWFLESRSSRSNPKRDWYIWHDGTQENLNDNDPNVFSFLCRSADGAVLVALNMSGRERTVSFQLGDKGVTGTSLTALYSSPGQIKGTISLEHVELPPFAALVAEVR